MINGQDKQQVTNINPMQAAVFALQFLEQVAHVRAQREAFDMSVSMLQAIASGQVVLVPSPQHAQPIQPVELAPDAK